MTRIGFISSTRTVTTVALVLLQLRLFSLVNAFQLEQRKTDVANSFLEQRLRTTQVAASSSSSRNADADAAMVTDVSRRSVFQSAAAATSAVGFGLASSLSFVGGPESAIAATRKPLDSLLYTILRVREATEQESRLIKSGKFKDVQRANVKLAVKFMVENYRLSDSFVAASAYLDGNDRRIQAGQIGQNAVQNLYTILEYFDSADVQNLKVGTMDNMAGKEQLVLKGLESTRRNIDDFLAYFPKDEVQKARSRIIEENELNIKEFDDSLGTILNLPPPS